MRAREQRRGPLALQGQARLTQKRGRLVVIGKDARGLEGECHSQRRPNLFAFTCKYVYNAVIRVHWGDYYLGLSPGDSSGSEAEAVYHNAET